MTIGIDSGLGAAYDATLSTGAANAQTTVYVPDDELIISDNDQFVVSAPAAGGAVTGQIVVYVEPVG